MAGQFSGSLGLVAGGRVVRVSSAVNVTFITLLVTAEGAHLRNYRRVHCVPAIVADPSGLFSEVAGNVTVRLTTILGDIAFHHR